MSVAVNIYMTDTTVNQLPISGAVASIVDPTTYAVTASATSDSTGLAAFLLPGSTGVGTTYEVRFFKLGVVFPNPVRIQVQEPAITTNKFNVSGTIVGAASYGIATDPRCCRVVGRFMHFNNQPMSNILVRFMQILDDVGFQVPKVVDGNLISGATLELRTDANGFISADLLRTGNYWCMFSGEDETVWNMLIPDRSSANLTDLLFPQPVSGAWDQIAAPSNAVTIKVGTSKVVGLSVTFSDFEVLTTNLSKWVQYTSSNTAVATIDPATGSITAIAPGTTNITISVPTTPVIKPVRIPTYSLTAPTLVVMVTP